MKQILLFLMLLSLNAIAQQNHSKATHHSTTVQPHQAQSPPKTEIEPGQNPGDTGKVTFIYNGQKVTYTTVRAKDGNIWAQQNLGSQHVANGYSDPDSWGDLFQWGRWDDGHQIFAEVPYTSNSTPSPNSPAGLGKTGKNPFFYAIYTWWSRGTDRDQWTAATPADVTETNGCDPCKVMGPGWHVPTSDELQNVFTKEFITDPNSAMLSNLKLTNDGYRDPYNGRTLYTRGKNAIYWSSTPATATGSAFGHELGGEPGVMLRGYGASVRCMKSLLAGTK